MKKLLNAIKTSVNKVAGVATEAGFAAITSLAVVPAILTYPIYWGLGKLKVGANVRVLVWFVSTLTVACYMPLWLMATGSIAYVAYVVGAYVYRKCKKNPVASAAAV